MRIDRRVPTAFICVLTTIGIYQGMPSAEAPAAASQGAARPASSLSCADMETFLKTAKIGPKRDLSVGVTVPSRAVLQSDTLRHEASIQTVDVRSTTFQTNRGTELNFRDTWQYNVAGYELAKILHLNMVPPYVERRVSGKDASVSWWVPDAMMEKDRYQKKIQPPDSARWNDQMYAARLFHELIADSDFNLTNLLITKDWNIWMIDFTRAFRMTKTIQNPKSLVKIDRTLLAGLRGLTADVLQQKLGRWVGKLELEGLLARRDAIVQFFEKELAAKGEAAVLYDLPRASEPCGTGL
jgi:hypothetical protein